MERQKELTIFEQFTNFMERETRAVQIVIYGIPAIGLSVALYKIRPFAKFEKPSDIPSHFISNKTPLRGTVKRIEPSHGTLLMVNHRSLIPLPRLREKKCLPVKIAGVNVTGHGVSWLQTIVAEKNIECIPLSKEKEYANCIVNLTLNDQERLQIGEELVKLGFATCAPSSQPSKDTDNLGYEKSLIRAQKLAWRKRNGYWHFARYPSYLWKMQMFFIEKLKSAMPVFITKHLNI